MKPILFDYKNSSLISDDKLHKAYQSLLPEIERITHAHNTHYTTNYASINLPFDTELLKTVIAMVKEKKELSPTTLVIVGIGGSSLGTIAVLEALRGRFYNEHCAIKSYFVDTVDSDYINDIAQLVEHDLAAGNKIILNIISKSGATTETIANAEIFLALLKKYHPDNYHHSVVVTTDENSALWHLAQKEHFACL